MTPNLAECERIARLYDAAPLIPSERVRRAYRVVAAYVDARYFGALPETGWRIEPTYSDALPDIDACRAARVLPVYDLHHAHPSLSDAENFRFRAVHDLFGHGWIGAKPLGFGLENERKAAHRQMADFTRWYYGPEAYKIVGRRIPGCLQLPSRDTIDDAARALRGEIYGQAAYYEARGAFPVQKAFLL